MGPTGPPGQQGERGPSGNTGPSGQVLILGYSVKTSDTTAPIPIPAGATRLRGRIIGGGGGGGGGFFVDEICLSGGGGGGSGQRFDFAISGIPPDSVYTVVCGTGGNRGSNRYTDITEPEAGGPGGTTIFQISSLSVPSYNYKFRADGGSGGELAPSDLEGGNGGNGFAGGGGGGHLTDVGQGGNGRMMDGYNGSVNWGGSGGIGGQVGDSGMNGSRGPQECIVDKNQYDTGVVFVQAYGGAGGGPYGADSNGFTNLTSFLAGQITNEDGILGGGGAGGGVGTDPTAGGPGYVELEWLVS